jgi:hypothetical protein
VSWTEVVLVFVKEQMKSYLSGAFLSYEPLIPSHDQESLDCSSSLSFNHYLTAPVGCAFEHLMRLAGFVEPEHFADFGF